MSVLMSSFLLFVLIAFPVANAIPAEDIDNLCKQTLDVAFCLKYIGKDSRIPAARDLTDVLLIAVTQAKRQVDDAITHMESVRGKYSGPNGKRRMEICRKDYGIAEARFHTAWQLDLLKSFWDVLKLARVATDAVIDCEDTWRRDGPIQVSPLTFYNMNVFKLSDIIYIIIQKIWDY